MRYRSILLSLISVLLLVSSVWADGAELRKSMEQLYDARLDNVTYSVRDLTIKHHDLVFAVDSGLLSFLEPTVIDGRPVTYGAYITGTVRFWFTPEPHFERGQLTRYFGTDTLSYVTDYAMLMFTDIIRQQVEASCTVADWSRTTKERHQARTRLEDLKQLDRSHGVRGQVLTALVTPSPDPFLFVDINPKGMEHVQYIFDPFEREEVQCFKGDVDPRFSAMELICSYSQHAFDPAVGINGLDKTRCSISHYDLDGTIKNNGAYVGCATLTARADSSVRVLHFVLHPQMEVDSVLDSQGRHVQFSRYEVLWIQLPSLFCFLDSELPAGAKTKFSIYARGKIAQKVSGYHIVTASSYWYPLLGFKRGATFAMTFQTPAKYTFCATGHKDSEEIRDNTLVTRWSVAEPTPWVSFAIGNLQKETIVDSLVGTIDLLYLEHLDSLLHGNAQDAMRLFDYRFGDYTRDHITFAEEVNVGSQAYPGFVQVALVDLILGNIERQKRLVIAHEAAHQWWGVDVDVSSYRDNWLTEGFAEYSALLYLQAAEGTSAILVELQDYRRRIVGARDNLVDEGAECAPVIMGPRAGSTKSLFRYKTTVYEKGAFILHMLRTMLIDWDTMREDKFYSLLKEWHATFKGKQASTVDFMQLTEKYTGEPMGWFFNQWVYHGDVPTIEFTYVVDQAADSTFTITGLAAMSKVPPTFACDMPVEIQTGDDTWTYVKLSLEGPTTDFTIPGLTVMPLSIRFNPFESVLAEVKP